jgi:hypothetical protein
LLLVSATLQKKKQKNNQRDLSSFFDFEEKIKKKLEA